MLHRVRLVLRQWSASAVREHLRKEIEVTDGSPELTANEIELVRFVRGETFDWDTVVSGRERGASDPSR